MILSQMSRLFEQQMDFSLFCLVGLSVEKRHCMIGYSLAENSSCSKNRLTSGSLARQHNYDLFSQEWEFNLRHRRWCLDWDSGQGCVCRARPRVCGACLCSWSMGWSTLSSSRAGWRSSARFLFAGSPAQTEAPCCSTLSGRRESTLPAHLFWTKLDRAGSCWSASGRSSTWASWHQILFSISRQRCRPCCLMATG